MYNFTNINLIKKTIIYGIITFCIITIFYNFFDKSITMFIFNSYFFKGFILNFSKIISTIFEPNIWVFISGLTTLVCIYNFIKNKRLYNFEIFSLSIIISTVITLIFKYSLARYRPELLINYNEYGFHFLSTKKIYNSMPSGHTALSFAGLLALGKILNKKKLTIILIILATIIGLCRIILLKHFMSDIILGAYIGIFSYLWSLSILLIINKEL